MQKGEKMNPVSKGDREQLWCLDCEQYLPQPLFRKDGKTSAGTQKYKARCNPCNKLHIEHHHTKTQAQRLREFVNNLKSKCVACGYDRYKGALDFHHVDSKTKEFEISDAVFYTKYSVEEIENEVSKCVVLCSNCHRETHAGLMPNESLG